VTLPASVVATAGDLLTNNASALSVDRGGLRMGSVYGMTPGSMFVQALGQQPIAPGVRAHSIIPTLGDGPLGERTDGVVQYSSAHIEGVDSELVIEESGHSTQANPRTINEVRRILRLQLAAMCGDARRCGPAPR
jgi:hypothetical protein